MYLELLIEKGNIEELTRQKGNLKLLASLNSDPDQRRQYESDLDRVNSRIDELKEEGF
jgi:hypothetical protein